MNNKKKKESEIVLVIVGVLIFLCVLCSSPGKTTDLDIALANGHTVQNLEPHIYLPFIIGGRSSADIPFVTNTPTVTPAPTATPTPMTVSLPPTNTPTPTPTPETSTVPKEITNE